MLKSFILSSSHNLHSISTPINYAINHPLCSSFIILSAYIIWYLISCYFYESQLSHIPKVGYSSPLRRPIDTFNSILRCDKLMEEGYENYGKFNLPFRIPNLFSGSMVILPPKMITELRSAREDVLSMHSWFDDENSNSHVFFTKHLPLQGYHLKTVRQAAKLPDTIPSLEREMEQSFDRALKALGKYEQLNMGEWAEIDPLELSHCIVQRLTWAVLGGKELANNEELMRLVQDYAISVFTGVAMLRVWKRWIRCVIGPFVTASNRLRVWKIKRILGPAVEHRMEAFLKNFYNSKDNKDILDSLISESYRLGPAHHNIHEIIMRVLMLSWAALHTTSGALANALLNLAAVDQNTGQDYRTILENELQAVFSEGSKLPVMKPRWTKITLSRVVGMASFLKETLRIHMVGAGQHCRRVVKEGGHTFSNRLYVPAGVCICVSGIIIHSDPENYPNPKVFDGLRFGGPYERGREEMNDSDVKLTMPTKNFVVFGGGHHICPGRNLADIELRMALAHFIENYDLELVSERPERSFMWVFQTPPLGLRIKIRRKS